MKRFTNFFTGGKTNAYGTHENTPSTDDLSAGFGKKYVFTSASKAGEAIDFHIPYSELWLDVSELGLKIVDRDENTLSEFHITKIDVFEAVGQSANAPAFVFTFLEETGTKKMVEYKFHTPQADSIFRIFHDAIEKASKSEGKRKSNVL